MEEELRLLSFCFDVGAAFCTKLTGGTENCPEGLLGGGGKTGRERLVALLPSLLGCVFSPSCDLGEMHERGMPSFDSVALGFRPSCPGGAPGGGAFPGGQPLGVGGPRGEEATEERGLGEP